MPQNLQTASQNSAGFAMLAMQHADQLGDAYVRSFLARAVPEPASALSVIGLGAMASLRRRRRVS